MSNALKECLKTAMHALRNASQLSPCPLYADGLIAVQNAINMEAQIGYRIKYHPIESVPYNETVIYRNSATGCHIIGKWGEDGFIEASFPDGSVKYLVFQDFDSWAAVPKDVSEVDKNG